MLIMTISPSTSAVSTAGLREITVELSIAVAAFADELVSLGTVMLHPLGRPPTDGPEANSG
jgi:hypothetical protein